MASDFAKTLETLIHFFNQKRVDYALIGGFTLSAYGLARQREYLEKYAMADLIPIMFEPASTARPRKPIPSSRKFEL